MYVYVYKHLNIVDITFQTVETNFTILASKPAVTTSFGPGRPRTTSVAACEFTTAGSPCVVTTNSTRSENEKSADYSCLFREDNTKTPDLSFNEALCILM